jgi:serine/threonine-protein kinase
MDMTPERWRDIARFYELALDQAPATREAFLAEACAGDEALRREVESLLRQETAMVVLDRPLWAIAAPLIAETVHLPPGAALGPYRIEGPLGAGGMGEVFRATDTRLNRAVAIKVLPTGVALNAEARARFAREARAVAALTHPNICTLYDVGRQDQVDFLVMECLEGETLAARLAAGPLPVDQAQTFAIEIAGALDHAHRHGIVHRDLKPANIMLTASGTKLLDFGLAKFRSAVGAGVAEAEVTRAGGSAGAAGPAGGEPVQSGDASSTRPGSVLGTIRYMAPEQIGGGEVDGRSDLFSFGAVLYEMLTGTRAFDGDNATAVRAAILERDPPRVSSLQPQVPAALDSLVQRLLAKHPGERWQSAEQVLGELKRVRDARSEAGWTRWRWAAAVLGAAVTGLAVWVLAGGPQRWSTNPTSGQIRSVAVLPLENLSGDPAQEYFTDGMTDQLIANLAGIGGLRVIRLARKPTQAVARELQVDAIIDGSVLHADGSVRITANLVRGGTGEIIWTQSFVRSLRDVLALQSEVASAITSKVEIALTPEEQTRLASARPVDPEGHQLFLLGRFQANKGTPDGLARAIQHFESAVAENPGDALPFVGLAEAYSDMVFFNYLPPREGMPKAKAAALAALKLDESMAEGHAALGSIHLFYDWDGPAAERELRRAIQLNPSMAKAHMTYAGYLLTAERANEAVQEIRRAVELDPLSARTHAWGTIFLIFARRYDEAIKLARKGQELEPTFLVLVGQEGLALAEQGKFEEAVRLFQKILHLDRHPGILAFGAHVHAVAGEREAARKLLNEAVEATKERYYCPYEIATAYVSLGDADSAHQWFRKGVEDRADCMAWLGVEPWVEPFRSDPRYAELLRDVGLTPPPSPRTSSAPR